MFSWEEAKIKKMPCATCESAPSFGDGGTEHRGPGLRNPNKQQSRACGGLKFGSPPKIANVRSSFPQKLFVIFTRSTLVLFVLFFFAEPEVARSPSQSPLAKYTAVFASASVRGELYPRNQLMKRHRRGENRPLLPS